MPPVVKPTQEELKERVQTTIDLLCDGKQDWEIKQALQRKYKRPDGRPMSFRSVSRYLARARAELLSGQDIGPDEMRAQFSSILLRDMNSADATIRDRQNAIKIMSSMYGLKSPETVVIPPSVGRDIYREALCDMSMEELKILARAHERAEQLVLESEGTVEGRVIPKE